MADTSSYQQTKVEQHLQSPQTAVVIGALLALAAVATLGFQYNGWRVMGGALIGALAGVALYHTSFGFTAAWRRIVTQRRGQGLRAQFLLISLVCLISFPLLQYGPDIGIRTGGFVFPFGVGAAVGAFIFGIGMQLGG